MEFPRLFRAKKHSVTIRTYFYTAILLYSLGSTAFAKSVEITYPNGLVISANYLSSDQAKPVVLLLHGFLQTADFFTVQRLTEYLSSEGYPVLAPTLSLGINKRTKSLSCDAIQNHRMQDDLKEIDFWVDWLAKKGHRQLILIGHSYGSLQLLVYMTKYHKHNIDIKKVIGTSLVDIDHTVGEKLNHFQVEKAKAMIAQKDNSLGTFQVSYCKKYTAPSDAFLSYADWGGKKIMGLLRKIHTPLYIILGSKDERMSRNWPDILRKAHSKVIIIKGANHFFDAQFEFDLADTVLSTITSN